MLASAAFASTEFRLEDQFDRSHSRAEVFGEQPVVILAGAQRGTPEAMARWVQTLQPQLPEGVQLYGLSNLKRLPFFVPKGAVRKTLKEQLPGIPVLCDWKGKVYPELGFQPEQTIAVGVFTSAGDRVGIVSEDATAAGARQVLELLQAE